MYIAHSFNQVAYSHSDSIHAVTLLNNHCLNSSEADLGLLSSPFALEDGEEVLKAEGGALSWREGAQKGIGEDGQHHFTS